MAVTEQQIREAARRGARTLQDLRRDLGVASECGSCATFARECLKDARETRPSPTPATRPDS
jgi:bacterioferritin-associated ferredoxin